MRIGILQFAPLLGDVSGNIARADEIIEDYLRQKEKSGDRKAGHGIERSGDEGLGVDLLMLPEMAFCGGSSFSVDSTRGRGWIS